MRFKAMVAVAALTAQCLASAAGSSAIQGTVVRVIDGDSLVLQVDGDAKPLEIRLQGIDAPEGCQAGGPEAREMLAGYVLDKVVTAKVQGRDHYGRTLATLEVDGLKVNERMVAEGHAWSLRTKWNRGPYMAQERMAQALKRGLHGTSGAVMPVDFRKRNGPCGSGAAAAPAGSPATDATAAQAPAAVAPALTTAAAAFRCDGRTHCSQMKSCAEATFFLNNCPGTKMDGNNDGVPCERQWCRR
jgi:endonuclease YncB( thermonuclease family)